MDHSRRLGIVAASMLLLAASVVHLSAQEGSPPAGRGERQGGGRNNIREFLGLGPAPDPPVIQERLSSLAEPTGKLLLTIRPPVGCTWSFGNQAIGTSERIRNLSLVSNNGEAEA